MTTTARKVRIRKIAGRWTWVCNLCHPPVHGATWRWEKTVANVTRHSTRNRRSHHEWVATHRAAGDQAAWGLSYIKSRYRG